MTQQTMPQPDPDFEDPGIPERRRNTHPLLIGGVVFMSLAATSLALAVLNWTQTAPPQPTTHTVVYEVDSSGTNAGSITLQAPTGTQQAKAALPLKTTAGTTGLTYPGFQTGAFVYLSVQNTNASGSVTCRIRVGDTVVSENTSVGGYVIATCKGLVP